MQLIQGDCLKKMRELADNSIDAIVSDPPYGWSFMGKKWDYDIPKVEVWREAFRILKPGGHMLVACGTRTQHRMTVNVEDAGFEIRDVVAWIYGSGFPKSESMSRALDIKACREKFIKEHGRSPAREEFKAAWAAFRETIGVGRSGSADSHGTYNMANMGGSAMGGEYEITAPTTVAAKQWNGWGTALKPAMELWTLARKPLTSTVAENVLEYGTGGINIDACRISTIEDLSQNYNSVRKSDDIMGERGYKMGFRQGKDSIATATESTRLGRFPANIILSHHPDCKLIGKKVVKANAHYPDMTVQGYGKNYGGVSEYHEEGERVFEETVEDWQCVEDCPVRMMDEQSGTSKSSGGRIGNAGSQLNMMGTTFQPGDPGFGDFGGASRFFYCAKASRNEREAGLTGLPVEGGHMTSPEGGGGGWASDNDKNPNLPRANFHPTVKPIALMRYLCKLITPPNGTVLDMFMGSGSTGCACVLDGFDFIGIELEQEYIKIAEARIKYYAQNGIVIETYNGKVLRAKTLFDFDEDKKQEVNENVAIEEMPGMQQQADGQD